MFTETLLFWVFYLQNAKRSCKMTLSYSMALKVHIQATGVGLRTSCKQNTSLLSQEWMN